MKLAARVAEELGADLIKTNYTGTKESFEEVVSSCPVPILIAGGPKLRNVRDVFTMVRDSVDAGGSGVCVGRNLWQQADPKKMAAAISMMVHSDASVSDAMRMMR